MNINVRVVLLISVFAGMWDTVVAQEVMTVEKCRYLALNNNRQIAMAVRGRETSRFLTKAYRANYFPKVSASANYLYTNARLTTSVAGNYLPTFVPDPATGQLVPNILMTDPSGNPVFKEYAYFPDMNLSLNLSGTWMAGLLVEQPVYAGGKITAAYRMAQTGEDVAVLNHRRTVTAIVVKTDEAYWNCVQMAELFRLATSYKGMLDELLRNVSDAHELGLKHRNEVLKVQVKVNEAELQLLQASNALRLSKRNLCHVTGIASDTDISFPETFDEYGTDISYAGDFSSRPEYEMLDLQIQLKRQQVRLTRSDFLPRVGILANYGYVNGLRLNGSKMFDRASLFVVASVSVPLFQWGEGRNKIRAAMSELEVARLEREDAGEQMALEIERAVDKCNESLVEVGLTKRALSQADENVLLAGELYAAGMETLSGLLEAQTVRQRAFADFINAVVRQRLNRTYFLKATGQLNVVL
jgi:outer membrane protein TolC